MIYLLLKKMDNDIFEQMINEENDKKYEQKAIAYKTNKEIQKKDGYKSYNNNYNNNYNKNYNGESKLTSSINEIKSTLNVLVDLELKRLNITKNKFNDLVENDMKKNCGEITGKNNNIIPNDKFEWTDKILEKIKVNINDKDKLRELRKKYNIPKSIFNKKIEGF